MTSQASYDPGSSRTLTDVVNIANIPIGARVIGSGVGREVYVRDKDEANQEITLNMALYDAAGTQNFTFERYQYILDFSGFSKLSKMTLSNLEFQCNGTSSAIMMAPNGNIFGLKDSYITRPKDRGLTSVGGGCQGMSIDRCQFLSNEDSLDVPSRSSIGFNTNANDIKVRNNRATKFMHFAVIGGTNSIISGNHFFQGDGVSGGIRSAGMVLTETHSSTNFTANYVDNCFLEWSNEHDSAPEFNSEFSFSAMSITNNVFLSGAVAPWFSYIVIKPHGEGHFLSGVNITGNKFRSINGSIDRAERVDTSFADLNYARFKHIDFAGNSFHAVDAQVSNPYRIHHDQASAAATWTFGANGELPFGAWVRNVDSVIARSELRNSSGTVKHVVPSALSQQGTNNDQVSLVWEEPMRGDVTVVVRIDE